MEADKGVWLDGAEPHVWKAAARSHAQFLALAEGASAEMAQRRLLEGQLARLLPTGATSFLPGFCSACGCYRPLTYDHLYAPAGEVNWRERLVCKNCELNNRLRLSLHLYEALIPPSEPVYLTEALTPFAKLMRERRPHTVMSEYLGPDYTGGQTNWRGLRHEDVTDLSFGDASFGCVMTFDVLEHVPRYEAALVEFHRVLRPGGTLMLSAPFVTSAADTICRAKVGADGTVQHLLPPEYHGDPVAKDKGILCYYHFGWDLLDKLRAVGFADASAELYWSLDYGYLGPEQLIILATK